VIRDSAGLTKPRELAVAVPDALGFAADGRLWGAVGDEVRVWDASGGQQSAWSNWLAEMRTGKSHLYAVSVARQWAAVGARDGEVHLFGAADGQRKAGVQAFEAAVRSVALKGDERLLAAGSDTGELCLLRVPGGALAARLTPHSDQVRAVSWSGRLLASGSLDGTVKLWLEDTGTLTELLTLRQPAGVRWLGFHRDGVRLFVLLDRERAVRVWHLDRLRARLSALGLGVGLEAIEAKTLPPAATAVRRHGAAPPRQGALRRAGHRVLAGSRRHRLPAAGGPLLGPLVRLAEGAAAGPLHAARGRRRPCPPVAGRSPVHRVRQARLGA
jgi:hypothetical protein